MLTTENFSPASGTGSGGELPYSSSPAPGRDGIGELVRDDTLG